ncbi:predicted protein [Postia placenta Mad-698-R]|uniref:Uncharacterized protein n=1 Tax=Postia placenta MAD-698-R-SB12 TaxID=670580 RepID=A0A1X6MXU8_9APHY|nr:hypothetical protein POSPLADRAFT_1146341 [Postia placenta MAD-698-R-SB12]EED84573.1 predicted protein [Postia placenta Mad-698-R]OSX61157.1 hypothetical protein POSPLADRAFT_1146341 [Postia placenta MAD-698-R-SB12]
MTSSVDPDNTGYLSCKRCFNATERAGTCALDVMLSSSNAWVWKQQGSCMFAGNFDRPYHAPLNDWPVYPNSPHRANATWIERIRVSDSDGKLAFTNAITESVAEAVTCSSSIHHLQSRIRERRREIHQNGYQHCGATMIYLKLSDKAVASDNPPKSQLEVLDTQLTVLCLVLHQAHVFRLDSYVKDLQFGVGDNDILRLEHPRTLT